MIGVYSKYFDTYPNGDKAQTVTILFYCEKTALTGEPPDTETLKLKFFDPEAVPELVNQQHRDMLSDFLKYSSEIFTR